MLRTVPTHIVNTVIVQLLAAGNFFFFYTLSLVQHSTESRESLPARLESLATYFGYFIKYFISQSLSFFSHKNGLKLSFYIMASMQELNIIANVTHLSAVTGPQ